MTQQVKFDRPGRKVKFPDLVRGRKLIVVANDEADFRRQVSDQKSKGRWDGPVHIPDAYPCILVGYEVYDGSRLTHRIVWLADRVDDQVKTRRFPYPDHPDERVNGSREYQDDRRLQRMKAHITGFAHKRLLNGA